MSDQLGNDELIKTMTRMREMWDARRWFVEHEDDEEEDGDEEDDGAGMPMTMLDNGDDDDDDTDDDDIEVPPCTGVTVTTDS